MLRANPHYWRGEPSIKEVDFIVVPDLNTRVLMMRTGEADLYYMPADDLVGQLEAIPGLRTIDNPFDEFWYIGFNTQHPPLDDVAVRRALSMAIDRDFIVRTIVHGSGSPADGDQPAFSWAYDPQVHAPAFDPAAAGRLLDARGWRLAADGFRWRDGKRLEFTYVTSSSYGEGVRFGPVFQQEMKRIGVAIEVKTYPTSLLYAAKASGGIVNNGRYDIGWLGWIGGVDPDDATLWACDQFPPNGYNESYYCDPRIDAAERIALSSFDQDVRRKAYWRIQELLQEDLPVDFLFWTHSRDVMRPDLQDYRPAPTVTEFSNPWQWHE